MRKIIGIATVVLMFIACAQDAPSPLTDMDIITYRKWIANNAPNAKLIDNDIYIEYFERPHENDTLAPRFNTSWLEMNYTGRKLDGTIFFTRAQNLSRLVGKWKNTTHWVDDFQNLSYYFNTILCQGLIHVMPNLREGDSARIYIPYLYAYREAMNINAGYAGETSTYVNAPIYFDLRLNKIINDPTKYELDKVQNYATQKWGMYINDTIVKGVYMRKTVTDMAGALLTEDEVANIDKSDYFLDDFILGTTVDSIAKKAEIYTSSGSYVPLQISMSEHSEDDPIVKKVLKQMRKGEQAEVVLISRYTRDGTPGNPSNAPQINPYTPRLYKIHLLVDKEEDK